MKGERNMFMWMLRTECDIGCVLYNVRDDVRLFNMGIDCLEILCRCRPKKHMDVIRAVQSMRDDIVGVGRSVLLFDDIKELWSPMCRRGAILHACLYDDVSSVRNWCEFGMVDVKKELSVWCGCVDSMRCMGDMSLLELVLVCGSINIFRYLCDEYGLCDIICRFGKVDMRCVGVYSIVGECVEICEVLCGCGVEYVESMLCECNIGCDVGVCWLLDRLRLKKISTKILALLLNNYCVDILCKYGFVADVPDVDEWCEYDVCNSLVALQAFIDVTHCPPSMLSGLYMQTAANALSRRDGDFVLVLNKISPINTSQSIYKHCKLRLGRYNSICDWRHSALKCRMVGVEYSICDCCVEYGMYDVLVGMNVDICKLPLATRKRMVYSPSDILFNMCMGMDDVMCDCVSEVCRIDSSMGDSRVVPIIMHVKGKYGYDAGLAILKGMRRGIHTISHRSVDWYNSICDKTGYFNEMLVKKNALSYRRYGDV